MQTATQGGVTLASTTTSQEELNKALDIKPSAVAIEQTETAPESETGTPENQEQQDKARGRGGFQRRIDKLTRDKTALSETLEQERLARQRLEAQLAGRSAGAQQAGVSDDPKPTQEQFAAWEDYQIALTRWAARQEHKTLREKDAQDDAEQSEQARLREAFDAHNRRMNAAREQYDDWDAAAEALNDGGAIPQSVGLAIVELENGPAVMYHLAKNPDLLAKLNDMSDVRAVAEIGRIAASLPAEKTAESNGGEPEIPEPRSVSTKPAPIKPVSGSATKVATDPTKMSLGEYNKWRDGGGGK